MGHKKWEKLVAISLTTLAPVYQNRINKLVDIVVIVNTRNLDKHHIFYNVRVYTSGLVFKVQAMINIGINYNLIAQNLVKKYDIPRDNEVPSLMAANRSRLRL